MANPLWDWGCKVIEHWPATKAKFQGVMESPWKETVEIGAKGAEASGQAAQGIFQFLFGPEIVYRSELGRSLLHGKPGGRDLGLLGADAETKLANSKFVEDHGKFLQMIDPLWEHPEPGMKTYSKDVADSFTDYLRGKTKTEDLPAEWRNDAAGVKQWVIDRYNATDSLKALSPGKQKGTWVLDDDVIKPTTKTIFNTESQNMGQYGLVHLVPKEIPYKIIKEGSADNVSGVDWLRAAGPMINRKNQFDPVMDRMREAIPNMSGIEKDYTERLLNRLTGRRTTLQNTIDGMVNNARFAFGGAPLEISPSARFAAGVSKLFYDGIMLYNPGMALLNMTQTLNTLAKEGEMMTLRGIKNFMSKEGQELAAERKFLGDLDLSFYRATDKNALQKGLAKFEHYGYKLFDKAEHYNRGIAFHAGLARFMQERGIKGLDEFLAKRGTDVYQEGMLAGIEASNESQFLYGVVNQSPYLSTPLAKLIGGQFMSFPLRQSEFMIKQLRQGNYAFFPRFIAYTGAASIAAYYGMGLAIGENLGGGGSFPEAMDLAAEGKTSQAIWAATSGVFKFLPETQSILNGVTPFGNLMVNGGAALGDTLGLLSSDDPEAKWARVGRSLSMAIPAGLELRRILEAGAIQYAQQGKRYRPEGLGEGLSIPVALSAAAKKVFGSEIPGVSTRYTGSLQREETGPESFKAALGLRGREIEMESRVMDINKSEAQDTAQGMSALSARIANALISDAPPEEFSQAMEAAVNSGLFADATSLHQSIENALRQRKLTDLEREQKRAPKSVKIKRAINAP
jgi:hypothetical protein